MESEFIHCEFCGAQCLNFEGECHPYMLAAPGCWMMFQEILQREYTEIKFNKGHQYTVDAYAIQHYGRPDDQRAVNSVHIHLASLYAMFERNFPFSKAPKVREQFSQYYKSKPTFHWLEPPGGDTRITVQHIWENEIPEQHFSLTQEWAKSVWSEWGVHHQRISDLVEPVLKEMESLKN